MCVLQLPGHHYTTPLLQGFHFISGIQFNLVVVVFQYFLILSTGCGHFEEPTQS